ncbi:MAG: hypothetical protein PHG05_02530 [Candidatus Nanoarchaeia archaeon]|nr:hypothetical protein [Candidatus Nanoarchaeia archaeon]
MQKSQKTNSKTLIIGFLIIMVIALMVVLIGDFTGQEVNTKSLVTVEPKFINAGEYITINIKPSAEGILKNYRICSGRSDLCHVDYPFKCGAYKCTKPHEVKYKTSTSWEGLYYVKVFDYQSETWIKSYFTVVNEDS